MKPKTVNCVLTVLSKLLKVAVEWKELASMPVSVKMVKAPDPELPFYDFEEFEQLVEGAGTAGADVLAFVLLAAAAELRPVHAEQVAQDPQERHVRGRVDLVRLAVDPQRDHESPPKCTRGKATRGPAFVASAAWQIASSRSAIA